MPAVLALVAAVVLGAIVYLSNGAAVRRTFLRDRRGDDPLRRIYAVDVAAVRQTVGIGQAIAAGLGVFVGVQAATLGAGLLCGLVAVTLAYLPVAAYERRRLREIRA